ncbi:ATP-binding cassette domain-containing protein [Helcococcus massiliensis]|uniref:ATP-binding cassette domain-containing protein n=1 Tax=Helcococcus massiliensis TaxID=2040290 RepID=UPI000CDE7062|nr:ATP-binding cassette domain-containing protein [Helcococcus massiliensis]
MDQQNNREVLVDVKDLEITFKNGKKKFVAVQGVNFQIFKGETFSLVGESGSGKTTIARAIVRLNQTSKGDIFFKGKKINGKLPKKEARELKKDIQMIFQDPAASLNERATIDYIIGEGIDNFKMYNSQEERNQIIDNAIDAVGLLPEHKSRYPHEFSGGQRQRVGIARSIVMHPDLIIADEPTSALDVSIRAQVLNLLNKFKKEDNITYLFIAHDLSVVRYFSDRIGVITEGRIVEIAETEELFRNPLHPYTKSLLNSVPIPDPIIEKNKVVDPTNSTYHAEYTDQHILREVTPGHLVMCTEEELESYRNEIK